jgi:hypothetical protein
MGRRTLNGDRGAPANRGRGRDPSDGHARSGRAHPPNILHRSALHRAEALPTERPDRSGGTNIRHATCSGPRRDTSNRQSRRSPDPAAPEWQQPAEAAADQF